MGITKQTDRVQIVAYGRQGVELFDQIEILLDGLIDETAGVAYRGANALEFKTKCTGNVVDFSSVCTKNMQAMAAAVTEAATFIATRLGGDPISLEPPAMAPKMPPIDADTSVESATDEPLRQLAANTTSTYNQIEQAFDANLLAFQNLGTTGWIGPEYDGALTEVMGLTKSTRGAIDNSRSVMRADIENQLTALGFSI